LSNRLAAENTCPLYKLTNGVLQARTATKFPRPAGAAANGYGSSLRGLLSAQAFPAFVDLTTVGNLGVANGHFPSIGDCAYADFKGRPSVLANDCCAVLGRATPQFATDTSAFADAPAQGAKDQSTTHGRDATKRATYVNQCAASQIGESVGHTVADAGRAVGRVAVNGAVTVGNGVLTVGSAIGNGAVTVGRAVGGTAVAVVQGTAHHLWNGLAWIVS